MRMKPFKLVYALIDLKDTTIKISDGTLGTLVVDSAPSDADVTFTDKSKHRGVGNPIQIEFIDPSAASQAFSITVLDHKITVDLETDAMSVILTDANAVKTGIDADAAATLLVTVVVEGDGTGLVDAATLASLSLPNNISIKIGEGNLTYNERREFNYTKDRGIIDTVREGDEQNMEVSMDFIWDFITAVSGSGTPTVEDAVKQRGEASAWLSTSSDTCEPYCVDIEVFHIPNCAGTDNEQVMLEEFRYEALDHDLREASVAMSGMCNKKEAAILRVA